MSKKLASVVAALFVSLWFTNLYAEEVSGGTSTEDGWSEWENYLECTPTQDFNWFWIDYTGYESPNPLQMMKRSNTNGAVELKLVKFVCEQDLVMSYDQKNSTVSWDRMDTGKNYAMDPSCGTVRIGAGSGTFSPKRGMQLNLSFLAFENDSPFFNQSFSYTFPSVVTVYGNISFTEDAPNSATGTVKLTNVSGISTLKYIVRRTNATYYYDANGAQKLYHNILKGIDTDETLEIKSAPIVNGEVEVKVDFEQSGPYAFMYVGFDDDNDWLVAGSNLCFASLIEEGKWEPIGTGIMTEPSLGNVAAGQSTKEPLPSWLGQEYEVTVEKNKADGTIYRVVNPYGPGTPFENFSYEVPAPEGYPSDRLHKSEFIADRTSGKQYYIIIHTEDPENVWCDYTELGVRRYQNDATTGSMMVTGNEYGATYAYINNPDKSKTGIKLTDNKIVGPDSYNPVYNPVKFTLQLPAQTSIEEVEIGNNEDAIYYNLQGQKVDNPGTGLYVIKRGQKVTKEFIRR